MVQEKSYNFVISNFYKKFTDSLLCQLESVFVVNQTEQKKKAILEITFQLLNEKRIKDIKIEEIAKKAVVSKVTLFKYYQNKSHLMNYVLLKSFEHMVDEIEEIINGDLDFTDTFQAIIDLELKQLKVFSPVFSENLMTQYSESPDFFDTDALLPQAKIYENLFEKGQKEEKISKEYTKEDFLFIINIFNSGMKGLSIERLLEKTELLSRFFLNGWK